MNYHMVHSSEIESLDPSLQFLAFSEAFLDSAARLCALLATSPAESSYARGAVVLSLAYHGVELFLKAAILNESANEQFGGKAGHNLENLGERYAALYPSSEFAFEIPFRTGKIDFGNLDTRVAAEFQAVVAGLNQLACPDQVHRYPRDTRGNPWQGPCAFEASSFVRVISGVEEDIARLKRLIFERSQT